MIDPRDGIDKEELKEADSMMKLYGRYGALGLQMVAITVLSIWAGHWIDGQLGWKFPVFTLLMAVFGLAGAIWYLYREVMKKR